MSVGVVNKQTGDRIPTAGRPAVDSVLSGSSTNPVQNRIVKAALDKKADTDMVAADFNAGTSYTAGNYCIYEGKFYKFKNNHLGAWSAADVDEIQIAGELSSIKSGLTDVNSYISTTEVITIANGFTPDSGITLASGSVGAPGHIYKRGNSVTVLLNGVGSATTGANGELVLGVLAENLRPTMMDVVGATYYNPLTTGSRFTPATVRILTNGTVGLITGLNAQEIGNSSYPWSTVTGLKLTYELN